MDGTGGGCWTLERVLKRESFKRFSLLLLLCRNNHLVEFFGGKDGGCIESKMTTESLSEAFPNSWIISTNGFVDGLPGILKEKIKIYILHFFSHNKILTHPEFVTFLADSD